MIPRTMVQETQLHHFVAEASTIGLPPGTFPHRLDVDIGNGRPFYRSYSVDRDGDLTGVVYRQEFGCVELHVFND